MKKKKRCCCHFPAFLIWKELIVKFNIRVQRVTEKQCFFSGEEDVLDRILELEIIFLFIYTM